MKYIKVCVAVGLLGSSIGCALAQNYPTRPIRMIVPFAAGGGTDVVARVIAPKLGQQLGQNVIIDNRTGASGNVGAEIVARATPERLDGVIKAVQAAAGDATAVESIVVDFYIVGAPLAESDRIATELSRQLDAANLPPTTQRVHLVWCERGQHGAIRQLTFRRRDDEFQEERVFRGLHPMIARRLRLWRLSNFAISRLPSADDVYVFACVARQNPADERLIAVAEVRDLTPLRDASGRVTSLPEL